MKTCDIKIKMKHPGRALLGLILFIFSAIMLAKTNKTNESIIKNSCTPIITLIITTALYTYMHMKYVYGKRRSERVTSERWFTVNAPIAIAIVLLHVITCITAIVSLTKFSIIFGLLNPISFYFMLINLCK